ncbi:MAG: hypothetical protein HYZ74_05465 [Elusimicrobia bacterium]|nr:hypothetical protein [Elusimicrobiota bacterium]
MSLNFNVNLKVAPRFFFGAIIMITALAAPPELGSESVTLTTYYPAPSGVYTNMITTGDTTLSREGGNLIVGSPSAPHVRIFSGVVQPGIFNPPTTIPPLAAAVPGGIYYDQSLGKFMGSNGFAWAPLGGGASQFSPEVVCSETAHPSTETCVLAPILGWGACFLTQHYTTGDAQHDDHCRITQASGNWVLKTTKYSGDGKTAICAARCIQ